MDVTKYTASCVNLYGIEDVFRLCHIPFIVWEEVYGVMALEGSSGTGKTTVIGRIGALNEAATGGKYGIYSADKMRYEDFVGCPIPDPETGNMRIYPMPNAIASKQLVCTDEANRASYDNQEKFMSLYSSRTIDGFSTECRYIYAAMNPCMSDTGENYEGVQPLDKAMGERMMALLRMQPFHELPKDIQIKIMKAGTSKQTEWKPSDEAVELHTEYLRVARELYAQAKHEHLDKILEYVYMVQKTLVTESKGANSIESRRAQFIVTNILATYALNSASFGSCSLERSAQEGLHISFPGRLWEQPQSNEVLSQAHKEAKYLLEAAKASSLRNLYSSENIDLAITRIKEAVDASASKEELNKLIHTGLPDKKLDPINHYVYSIGVVDGLTNSTLDNPSAIMKAQEFNRLSKIVESVASSAAFVNARKAGTYYSKKKSMPEDYRYPEYIDRDLTSEVQSSFDSCSQFEISWYTQALIELAGESCIRNGMDFVEILERLAKTIQVFRNIADKVLDPTIEWWQP